MPIDGINGPGRIQIPGLSVVRPMFRTLGIAASGLSAQRQRLETIAQNIANANTTHGPDGLPYQRRTALLQAATVSDAQYPPISSLPGVAGIASPYAGQPIDAGTFGNGAINDGPRTIEVPVLPPNGDGQYGVTVAGIGTDQSEGRKVYEPGHPDADADGYVHYPNVDTSQEMVNLLDAKRIYEANASVFQAAKSMLRASLDI